MKTTIVSIAAILTLLSTNYPPHTAQAEPVTVKIELDKVYSKQQTTFPDRVEESKSATRIAEAKEKARLEDLRAIEAKKVIETPSAVKSAPIVTQNAPVDDNSAKMFIYNHESGNNPSRINKSSGACGLGQALPCSKMGCALGDYACQDAFFTKYMLNRYGSWENARAFWLTHKWW